MVRKKKPFNSEDIVKDRVEPGKSKGGKHQPSGFIIKESSRGPLANDDPHETTNPHFKPGKANGVPEQ